MKNFVTIFMFFIITSVYSQVEFKKISPVEPTDPIDYLSITYTARDWASWSDSKKAIYVVAFYTSFAVMKSYFTYLLHTDETTEEQKDLVRIQYDVVGLDEIVGRDIIKMLDYCCQSTKYSDLPLWVLILRYCNDRYWYDKF
jgi:hypothetical protein